MNQIKLESNQAALFIEISPEGNVNVDAAFPKEVDSAGDLAAAICNEIGKKITTEEKFQQEIMDSLTK